MSASQDELFGTTHRASQATQNKSFGTTRLNSGTQKRRFAYEGHVVHLRNKGAEAARSKIEGDPSGMPLGAVSSLSSGMCTDAAGGYRIMRTNNDGSVVELKNCNGQTGSTDLGLLDVLRNLVAVVLSEAQNPETRLKALVSLRQKINVPRRIPIEEVVQSGALTLLLHLIDDKIGNRFINEASFCLTNIIADAETHDVSVWLIANDIFERFARVLQRTDLTEATTQQCVWCIGNLMQDTQSNTACRDKAIQLGLVDCVFQIAETSASRTSGCFYMCVAVCLSLLQSLPLPSDSICRRAATICVATVMHTDEGHADTSVIENALAALEILALKAGTSTRDGVVLLGLAEEINLTPHLPERLVSLARSPNVAVARRAVRAIANFVSTINSEALLEAGLAKALFDLLTNELIKPKFTAHTLYKLVWTVENLAAEEPALAIQVMEQGLYLRAIEAALSVCVETRVTAMDGTVLLKYRIDKTNNNASNIIVSAVHMLRNLTSIATMPGCGMFEHMQMCVSGKAFEVLEAAVELCKDDVMDPLAAAIMSVLHCFLAADKLSAEEMGYSFGAFHARDNSPMLMNFADACTRFISDDNNTDNKLKEVEQLMSHRLKPDVQVNFFNSTVYPVAPGSADEMMPRQRLQQPFLSLSAPQQQFLLDGTATTSNLFAPFSSLPDRRPTHSLYPYPLTVSSAAAAAAAMATHTVSSSLVALPTPVSSSLVNDYDD